jgi:hypothetical protein
MSKHLPLMVGIVFVIIAITLGFIFDSPTPLQSRLVIGTWALAAGGITTEMPSALGVEWDLRKKIAAGATGAIAVFAILCLLIRPE